MKLSVLTLGALLALSACGVHDVVTVTVDNSLDVDRNGEIVELPSDSVLSLLGADYCYVTDSEGREIPSQLTHDGLLIFQADVAAASTSAYTLHAADTLHVYDTIATGRIYPERADDIAWENESVGFRVYGPTTQSRGEKAYGYDIFFKHPTPAPILERLYAPETDPLTWQKRDSLLAISKELADSFVNTISYHIDHGLGMDCYAVGPTLGDGVAALMDSDTICYAWCYKDAQVLDNGPLRFTVRMNFAPMDAGSDTVTESRVIRLDAGSHLNRCDVRYEGLGAPRAVAAGFPLRDQSAPYTDPSAGIVAYADPTQGPDNGKALLGLIMPGSTGTRTVDNHIVAFATAPADTAFTYYWGFAWDRADISDMDTWARHLHRQSATLANPLNVTITRTDR